MGHGFRHPGRVLFVVDDSESMTTPENALADEEALRLGRLIRGSSGGQGETWHDLAETLSSVEARLRAFERGTTPVVRTQRS